MEAKKLFLALCLITLFTLPSILYQPLKATEHFPGLKKGAIYKYSGFLKTTTQITHKITASIEITDVSRGATITYKATIYFEIEDLRYGHEGEKFTKSMEVAGEIAQSEMYKTLGSLNWTEIIDFNPPIDITTFFDVSDMGAVERYWTQTVYQERILERPPIYKSSWDIILGSYRRIIYMEIYTAKWLIIGDNQYLTELDISIDESLGIVTKMRLYYAKTGVSYELKMELSDTNMFAKNTFMLTIGSIIAIIIIISVVIYRFREKIFRKKIPIPK